MARAALTIALTIVVASGALGATAAPATHLGYKKCRNLTLRRARVTHLQSNFGCRRGIASLRRLLVHGIRRLPRPTSEIGKWGCQTGTSHYQVCERRLSGPQAPQGLAFAARPRRARQSQTKQEAA